MGATDRRIGKLESFMHRTRIIRYCPYQKTELYELKDVVEAILDHLGVELTKKHTNATLIPKEAPNE